MPGKRAHRVVPPEQLPKQIDVSLSQAELRLRVTGESVRIKEVHGERNFEQIKCPACGRYQVVMQEQIHRQNPSYARPPGAAMIEDDPAFLFHCEGWGGLPMGCGCLFEVGISLNKGRASFYTKILSNPAADRIAAAEAKLKEAQDHLALMHKQANCAHENSVVGRCDDCKLVEAV